MHRGICRDANWMLDEFHAGADLKPGRVQRSNISISCSQVDLDDEKSSRMRASARDPAQGCIKVLKPTIR